MITILDSFDWGEAFACGGIDGNYNGGNIAVVAGSSAHSGPFSREDVEHIERIQEGENDGASWMLIARLNDGRWVFIEAWCDYTGWDCQSDSRCWVATSKAELYVFGVTELARDLWSLNEEFPWEDK